MEPQNRITIPTISGHCCIATRTGTRPRPPVPSLLICAALLPEPGTRDRRPGDGAFGERPCPRRRRRGGVRLRWQAGPCHRGRHGRQGGPDRGRVGDKRAKNVRKQATRPTASQALIPPAVAPPSAQFSEFTLEDYEAGRIRPRIESRDGPKDEVRTRRAPSVSPQPSPPPSPSQGRRLSQLGKQLFVAASATPVPEGRSDRDVAAALRQYDDRRINVGDIVDYCDRSGRWRLARVAKVAPHDRQHRVPRLCVEPLERRHHHTPANPMRKMQREWLPFGSDCIAPRGIYTGSSPALDEAAANEWADAPVASPASQDDDAAQEWTHSTAPGAAQDGPGAVDMPYMPVRARHFVAPCRTPHPAPPNDRPDADPCERRGTSSTWRTGSALGRAPSAASGASPACDVAAFPPCLPAAPSPDAVPSSPPGGGHPAPVAVHSLGGCEPAAFLRAHKRPSH